MVDLKTVNGHSQQDIARANDQARKYYSEYLFKHHGHRSNEYTLLGLETVKHVALVSLAGLGGVFALLSGNKFSTDQLFGPAAWFALSTVFCIFCMYGGMVWRKYTMDHYNALLTRVYANDFPQSHEYGYNRKTRLVGYLADALGWLAFLSALAGGVMLFLTLAASEPPAYI